MKINKKVGETSINLSSTFLKLVQIKKNLFLLIKAIV